MRPKKIVALAAMSFFAACIFANAQASPNQSPKKAKTTSTSSSTGAASEGEQRFRANCGRCHNPPESLSPREVRAVARHMRVRAMLSAEDEKLILEFLAP
jgi:mono/diheme cytochrome c family protein